MLTQIQGSLMTFTLRDGMDILLVAIAIYKLYYMLRDTRALALLKGILLLFAATLLSKWLGLKVINQLLETTRDAMLVALPVVFQPELRRALEQLGRGHLFRKHAFLNEEELEGLLNELMLATTVLSRNKIGALLVLERVTGLKDYIETGIQVDGLITKEFLINIFVPNTPMHDGAVILRGDRVMAVGCLLPLTEDRTLNKELGTRHRAAIGITEQSDAVVIVVSEETGVISLARSGRLLRHVDAETLKDNLRPLMISKSAGITDFFHWRQSNHG